MDVIDDFVGRYRREFDFYDQAARLAAQRLEVLVQAAGIRAIVTARAKHPFRLEAKVRQRHSKAPYESVEQVYGDIVDLAGVRLALYFPGDRGDVDRMVRAQFELLEEAKEFPQASKPTYKKRFSGYWATHYRIRLPESALNDAQKRYGEARIELQVASVLMHAWSEVDHDLVYKPLEGNLSEDEYAILDELNGLVITGEIALELLQRAIKARVAQKGRRFANHFDLAAFLLDAARPILSDAPDDAALGRIDLLYGLVERLELDTPEKIESFLKTLHSDTERRPIAEQIIDQILGADQHKYALYSELRAEREFDEGARPLRSSEIEAAMGRFLHTWIDFEKTVRSRTAVGKAPRRWLPVTELLRVLEIQDPAIRFDLERIRHIRNNLVHGIEVPDSETLDAAAGRLAQITSTFRRRRKR